jgi:hypothetical protein
VQCLKSKLEVITAQMKVLLSASRFKLCPTLVGVREQSVYIMIITWEGLKELFELRTNLRLWYPNDSPLAGLKWHLHACLAAAASICSSINATYCQHSLCPSHGLSVMLIRCCVHVSLDLYCNDEYCDSH